MEKPGSVYAITLWRAELMDGDARFVSRELIKLLNIYFRGIVFTPLIIKQPDESSSDVHYPFPEVTPYVTWQENQKPELDIQGMAENDDFSSLFPKKPVPQKQDWENFSRWFPQAKQEKKLGGVIRFFVEKDDQNFIDGFNTRAGEKQKIEKGSTIGIPESFFDDIDKHKCYCTFDPEHRVFRWDLKSILANTKDKSEDRPVSIYMAYRRYAHARYSCWLIDPQKTGYESWNFIFEEYCKIHGDKSQIPDVKRNIIFSCVRYALELFQSGAYIPCSLAELIPIIKQESANRLYEWNHEDKEMNFFKYPLDAGEVQDIKNYCGENPSYTGKTMPGVLSSLGMEKEENEFYLKIQKDKHNGKTFDKVNELHRLITAYPSVRDSFSPKTIEIMKALYLKSNTISGNWPLKGDDKDFSSLFDVYEDEKSIFGVSQIIERIDKSEKLNAFLKKNLYNEFEKAFPVEPEKEDDNENEKERKKNDREFLEFVLNKPVSDLCYYIEPYANVHKGDDNTGNGLFVHYCIITKKNKSELLGKIHTLFGKRIRKILGNLKKEMQKEEGLVD